jgi:hypothetical protein
MISPNVRGDNQLLSATVARFQYMPWALFIAKTASELHSSVQYPITS